MKVFLHLKLILTCGSQYDMETHLYFLCSLGVDGTKNFVGDEAGVQENPEGDIDQKVLRTCSYIMCTWKMAVQAPQYRANVT